MGNRTRRTRSTPATLNITSAIDSFLSEYGYSGSPSTHAVYKYQMEALRQWCEHESLTAIGELTPDVIRGYLTHIRNQVSTLKKKPLAPATIAHRFRIWHRFFEWCIEQDYLEHSPADKVKRPSDPESDVSAFTREEVTRLLHHAGNSPGWLAQRDRAIVAILFGTGARAAELCALTEADIDWKNKRVTLHGKGREGRTKDRMVPLGPKVATAIKEYLRVRPASPEPRIFLSQTIKPLCYAALAGVIDRLGEYAGVEDCHAHRFRHTAATELGRRTGNILMVKSFLGHDKIQTTERYLLRLKAEYGAATYSTPDTWLL